MADADLSIGSSARPSGWRILGFGKHPQMAAAVEAELRAVGINATNFALTNDQAGDARLVAALKQADYDGVAIERVLGHTTSRHRPVLNLNGKSEPESAR
ncbi:MAG: hypothetical protein GC162_15390 [Planctomycetes bacterium]|nr:hypothetical protein [Planctomycetota bacterium]